MQDADVLEQAFEKNIDSEGAGATMASPGWLTQLGRLWGGKSVRRCHLCVVPLHKLIAQCLWLAAPLAAVRGIRRICISKLSPLTSYSWLQDTPVADAKPDDIKDLLGGALFKALYKWMEETGPVYLLPTGPVSSFLVVSDPAAARHVLQRSDNPKNNVYGKGLVAEVSKFLFGDGFATSGALRALSYALFDS